MTTDGACGLDDYLDCSVPGTGGPVQLIDLSAPSIKNVLNILLEDKTTKKNIIWATDAYASRGRGCTDADHILPDAFYTGVPVVLKPRTEKAFDQQVERTRKKAEVFTPVWLCNRMNNYCDEQWFGRKEVFNRENNDRTWTVIEEKILFPEGKGWQDFVDSRRLEITCGEAPYLVSRYDAASGALVLPLVKRIGILDRKLRIVNENAQSEEQWLKWSERAFQSCYGYEWQGDSLLIARINLLLTFCDYYSEKWEKEPDASVVKRFANVIAWNIWQMDGLNDTVPFGKPFQEQRQMTLFDSFEDSKKTQEDIALPCKMYDWRRDNSLAFNKCKARSKMSKKMFDFVIGNPPYQETQDATSDTPVYNLFMDSAYMVGDCVELITPGRFLFDAGKTPKTWNRKMLDDPHLTVLEYVQDSSLIFAGVDIKGGVAITYRDSERILGPIGLFSSFPELNSLLHKIQPMPEEDSLDHIIFQQTKWNLDALYVDYPDYKNVIGSGGRERRLTTPILSLDVFHNDQQNGDLEIIGLVDTKRVRKYVKSKYVEFDRSNLNSYKVILPKSNGSGAIGEVLSTPLVGEPLVGYTQSFLSFGSFETANEAEACLKYIKTKFARCLLGTLKVTQDNNKGVWVNVPNQDYTSNSDIDWSRTVSDIDKQLYRKYKLSCEEIDFIEKHIKEMA